MSLKVIGTEIEPD